MFLGTVFERHKKKCAGMERIKNCALFVAAVLVYFAMSRRYVDADTFYMISGIVFVLSLAIPIIKKFYSLRRKAHSSAERRHTH